MSISVVIPTLDEASGIVACVESALDRSGHGGAPDAGGAPTDAPEIEVLVVDGGSRDETVRLAREAGARVRELATRSSPRSGDTAARPRGRAHQLRIGSEETTGEGLVFLHADTRLEPGWSRAVAEALQDEDCAGGAFAFRFAERGAFERWMEWWVARRVAILGLPYGDQAIFVRRSVLERMGGVPSVPMMEDLDLVHGIRRAGRMAQLPQTATTSSRRYRRAGRLRTLFWHQVALLGWLLGWDRAWLAARMGR